MCAAKTSDEEVLQTFSRLRLEQQQNAQKLAEMEQDLHEHTVVIEVLESVDKSRKCFRMVGEVLVERTVADILPALKENMKQLKDKVDEDKKVLVQKSREVSQYQQKHNIRVQFRGTPGTPTPTEGAAGGDSVAAS